MREVLLAQIDELLNPRAADAEVLTVNDLVPKWLRE